VMPRNRFVGAQNVATIKDGDSQPILPTWSRSTNANMPAVNFVGPDDQWVISGSDDGNFFIWDKKSEKLHGIYEGDSTVVNVIEGHPHFPLLATSGIDTSIKVGRGLSSVPWRFCSCC
jgi:WD40 repeat protein